MLIEEPRAISSTLVISQVYGGGGNSNAPYTHDFVELYNRSSSAVSLGGLSIQYASATGTGNFGASTTQLTELPNVTLDPDRYFLVQMAGGTTGAALPTPDHVDPTPILMAAGAGKVALVTGTDTLGCNGGSTLCNPAQLARIIDLVGYGTANFFEGAAVGTLSNTTAGVRLAGNVDTDDNSADFEVKTPNPRNRAFEPPPPPVHRPIYELQGDEETSLFKDTDVSTTGIVTARKTNGFFIQVPDIEGDGDVNTSDALFVFTGVAPVMAVGDEVRVVGRLVEFRSTSAVSQGTLTEISNPVVTVLSSGNTLPAALDLAALLAAPASFTSRADQFEQYESMLVTTSTMDVVGPSNAFGELYAVVSGTPRTFREPGIDVGEPLPAEAPAGVERFDGNFERVMLDSDDLVNAAGARRPRLDLPVGTPGAPVRVLNIFGPLDYAFDNYRVALDASATSSGGRSPQPVPARETGEFTIASLNLENFRDGTPNFESRKAKSAQLIVDVLRTPDILGLIEVGDLEDLESLASAINSAAGTDYRAYLLDGDGATTGFEQNIGYLVNDARVEVFNTFQVYQGKTFEFGGQTDLLHDRPPFVLEARVRHSGTPVTVILNHLRSLIDVNSGELFGSSGLTVGARVREKRRLQAEDLADLVASRIDENLVVLGDLNAFEFSDGLVDVVGTIEGSPAPADEVTEASVDRWAYELTNLAGLLPADDRYSYVFEGNAQVLDHVLVNDPMLARLSRFTYARNNTDFPESFEADFSVTTRLSDHDAAVAYFGAIADLGVAATTSPVSAGGVWSAQVSVTNSLDTANSVTLSLVLPAGVVWQSTTAPEGWTCSTSSGMVTCIADTLVSGSSAAFEVAGSVACSVADGTTLGLTALAGSATSETETSNNAASASSTVSNPAPMITGAAPSPSQLRLALHQFVRVNVQYNATDACGPVSSSLTVTSNEPVTGVGQGVAGLTSPDWIVIDEHRVLLRAERSPRGDGRVYTITISAVDVAGGVATQDVKVTVPR
jgi:predicted extracellular nuclease